ncbi:hypothetical protein L1987_15705 [Smallanthus sonchifolius]|uniref:Uncharacterized protein n=1 Tax=Smallanthus sonchifolius TaxID=185202 RepID=A0ACB9J8Z7_9ASTR|nr:hypothetical protein L1987_15705 [Smallanthus sonchifolius]
MFLPITTCSYRFPHSCKLLKCADYIEQGKYRGQMGQANVSRTSHIMWTMGEDFKYQYAESWFKQMDKLIHYVNLVQAYWSVCSIRRRANSTTAVHAYWPHLSVAMVLCICKIRNDEVGAQLF